MKGTPKNLREAFSNALDEFSYEPRHESKGLPATFQDILERHVGDYLAQKFMVAGISASIKPLDNDGVIELYELVMGEEYVKNRKRRK